MLQAVLERARAAGMRVAPLGTLPTLQDVDVVQVGPPTKDPRAISRRNLPAPVQSIAPGYPHCARHLCVRYPRVVSSPVCSLCKMLLVVTSVVSVPASYAPVRDVVHTGGSTCEATLSPPCSSARYGCWYPQRRIPVRAPIQDVAPGIHVGVSRCMLLCKMGLPVFTMANEAFEDPPCHPTECRGAVYGFARHA